MQKSPGGFVAKRFRDAEIWKHKWYRKLGSVGRDIWNYIHDNCDHAGLFVFDDEAMSFALGIDDIKIETIKKILGEKIIRLSDDKFFLPEFIEFQYKCTTKNLNPENRVHKSVLDKLAKYKKNKGLESPLLGAKDKDIYKDKDKDKDKDPVLNKKDPPLISPENENELLGLIGPKTLGRWLELYPDQEFINREIKKAILYYEEKPMTIRGWKQALSSWFARGWEQHKNNKPQATEQKPKEVWVKFDDNGKRIA